MSNHFHLAVETPEPNLSLGMKWLQGTWARRANLRNGVAGRPFQGRYKALIVEPGLVLAQVAHYVHLNPVRAKIVVPGDAARYRWSSLNRYVHGGRPSWLVADGVLCEAGELSDTRVGWRNYCQYLAWLALDEPGQRARGFERMCQGWSVGSGEFKLAMQTELLKQSASRTGVSLLGREREDVKELREMMWEERLQEEAARLGVSLDRLPSKKSAPEKVRLAAALKANTSVSNGWLAKRLHMGEPATVSQYVRRFHLASKDVI